MSEQKPEKKVVGRTVAIALGIICIILVVGLVGAVIDYSNQVNDLSGIANMEKVQVLYNETFHQGAGNYSQVKFQTRYSGFIVVGVIYQQPVNQTQPTVYVRCAYISNMMSGWGTTYNQQIMLLPYGATTFEVLPSPIVFINVGNTNSFNASEPSVLYNETVIITYYY
jgi:hypothetical protein